MKSRPDTAPGKDRRHAGSRATSAVRAAIVLLAVSLVFAVAACAPRTGSGGVGESVPQATGKPKLVVWADEVRSKMVEQYAAAHPEVDVTIETIPYTISAYQQKLSLANQSGSGWPDVWGVPGALLTAFAIPPYDFAADIGDYLPDDFGSGFSEGSMTQCRLEDRTICIPYQVSPFVLFYNAPLMEEWGYEIPTTWEEYHALGLKVAEEHPGYVVGAGADGGVTTARAYLSPSRCNPAALLDASTIYSNLDSEECLRAVKMMDSLMAAGVLPPMAGSDPEFIKDYGATDKWLMYPAAIFQIKNLFQNRYETDPGVLGMAPPLRWADDDQAYAGRTGGTAFMVSRHSEYKQASVDLALWLARGPVANDPSTVTVPAFNEARKVWTDDMEASGYVTVADGDVASVFDTAIAATWADISDVPVDGINYKSVVAPLLLKGGTIEESLPAWAEAIENQSRAAGFSVVHER